MASKTAPMPSLAAQPAQPAAVESKPKPCCVCKDEKAKRDECMLFTTGTDPSRECKTTIEQYKSCMLGFGFQV